MTTFALVGVILTVASFGCSAPVDSNCKRKENGHHALESDFSKFLLCLDGAAYVMPCPDGLRWSAYRGYCDVTGDEKEETVPKPQTSGDDVSSGDEGSGEVNHIANDVKDETEGQEKEMKEENEEQRSRQNENFSGDGSERLRDSLMDESLSVLY